MLTQNQQQTIQFITETFEKLNKASEPKKFNLVNTDLLLETNERIKALDKEEAAEKKIWENLACEEASRIAELLRQDLPTDGVVVLNSHNEIRICKQEIKNDGSVYTHSFGRCCIEIRVVIKWDCKKDEYGISRRKYSALLYEAWTSTYETIEKLVSDRNFTDRLRTEIL
jgi:hypothetical protein